MGPVGLGLDAPAAASGLAGGDRSGGTRRRRALGLRMSVKRDGWVSSDTTTIMGRSRTPATDGGTDEDHYTVINLEVITRAMGDLKARRAEFVSVILDTHGQKVFSNGRSLAL